MEKKHLINFFGKVCVVKYKSGNSPKYLSTEGLLIEDGDGVILDNGDTLTKITYKNIRGIYLK